MPAPGKLTNGKIRKIIELYVVEKKSPYQLAELFDVKPNTVLYHLKKSGIEIRDKKNMRRRWDIPETDELKKLYESGISAYELGKQFDVAPATIYLRLKKVGVTMRAYDEALLATKNRLFALEQEQKEYLKVKKWAKSKTFDEILKKAQSKNPKPKYIEIKTMIFKRNYAVMVGVKRRANGICDLCGQKAPFEDSEADPYLECHHLVWLSQDGEDTIQNSVALCPNCHRRMHIVKSEADLLKLKKKYSI